VHKHRQKLTTGLLIFVLAGTALGVWVISRPPTGNQPEKDYQRQGQTGETVRRATPEASWEPIFFKLINEHTSESRIPGLRTVPVADNNFEIRIWVGFGINGEDGIILRHSSNQWSAVHLHGMAERPPLTRSVNNLDVPKSGWEAAWQRLTQAGILTLPDGLAAGCKTDLFDGTSYVVEINKDETYRTYLYDNPKYSRCSEAKQMVRIGEIIAEEFNLREFRISDS
jgi:hypothetical protein